MALKKKSNIFKKVGSVISKAVSGSKPKQSASVIATNKIFPTTPGLKKATTVKSAPNMSIAPNMSVKPTGVKGFTGTAPNQSVAPKQTIAPNQTIAPKGYNPANYIPKGGTSNKNNTVTNTGISTDTTAITSPLSLNRTAGASQGTQTGTNNVNTGTGAVTGGLTNVDSSLLKNIPDPLFPEKTATEVPTIYQQPITEQQNQNEFEKAQQDYLANLAKDFKKQDTGAELYKKAQQETQILEKQQKVNELAGKLNAIVAKGEANQLAQVGQGRGIPEAIIGGIQAQIGRETAIAALPVQAQLDAAQGDLQSAEANLNLLFKIYSDDAKNEYEYKKSVRDAVYNFASEKYKTELDKINKQKDREYEEKQREITMRRNLAIEANKNGAPAIITNAILNSTDFASALSAAGKYGTDPLDRQIKQAQLNKLLTESSTTSTSAAVPGAKPTGKPDFVSAGFANRAEEANKTLTNVEVKNKGLLTSVLVNLRETRPFIKPNKLKQYDQAQQNFLKAVLRKESGATITAEEEASYAPVYFAYPGDTNEVILQKQRARIDALNSLIGASGTAYDGTFQEKPATYRKANYNSVQPVDSYLDSIDSTLKSTTNLYSQAGYEL